MNSQLNDITVNYSILEFRIYTIIVVKVYSEVNATYTINQTYSTIIVNDPDWKYTILRFGNYQKDSFLNNY